MFQFFRLRVSEMCSISFCYILSYVFITREMNLFAFVQTNCSARSSCWVALSVLRAFCVSTAHFMCGFVFKHVKLISIKGQMNLFAQWLPMNV